MTDNLKFYKMGAEVPKEAQKEFNNGRFKGTDINRMWRIKVLTEMFGPAGIGWDFKLTTVTEKSIPEASNTVIYAKGELRVRDPETKEWSEPIIGYGGNFIVQYVKSTGETRINDDAYKMVETDAFGAACSKLGIGASVYWANDKSKYTKEEEPQVNPASKRETKDSFFTKKTATAEASPTCASSLAGIPPVSAEPTPSDKEIMDTILKAKKDPKTKPMVQEWESKNNIGYIYETTPAQRMELFQMIRSVA